MRICFQCFKITSFIRTLEFFLHKTKKSTFYNFSINGKYTKAKKKNNFSTRLQLNWFFRLLYWCIENDSFFFTRSGIMFYVELTYLSIYQGSTYRCSKFCNHLLLEILLFWIFIGYVCYLKSNKNNIFKKIILKIKFAI